MLHKYIDDLGNNITYDICHLTEVTPGGIDAVCEFAKKPDTVRCKFGQHGQKNGAKGVFSRRSTNRKIL